MMKTVMINASPKRVMKHSAPSASYELIQITRRSLRKEKVHDLIDYHIKPGKLPRDEVKPLLECETWIISFPIYFGGLPANLLKFMTEIQSLSTSFIEKGTPSGLSSPIRVYAVANGELYDGREAEAAFEMLEHWCEECGFIWGSGLGVGGGPIFGVAHTFGDLFRIDRSFSRAMTSFSMAVAKKKSAGNFYCTPSINKARYVLRMNRLKRKLQKAHKLP